MPGASLLIVGPVTVTLLSSNAGTFSTQLPPGAYTLTAGPVTGLFPPAVNAFSVLPNQPVLPIAVGYIVNCPNC